MIFTSRQVVFITICLALSSPVSAQDLTALDYSLRPLPRSDRTDLEVELTYRPQAGEPATIALPRDCYGTPDLDKAVIELEGLSGSTVSTGSDARHRMVAPGPDGQVRLRYVMSYAPEQMAAYAFSPNTGPGHFHVAACQWMMRVGDDEAVRPYRMRITSLPQGWRGYTSRNGEGLVVEQNGAYSRQVSTAFGASAGHHRRFEINGRPVDAFAPDDIVLPGEQVLDSIEAIVRIQRGWMADDDFPHYTVAVHSRANAVAGTAPQGLFVAFVKPDVRPTELNLILAHEMFHNWLPNKLQITSDDDPNGIRFDWFKEGFADYLARRALLQAGLISEAEFVALINADLANMAENPTILQGYADVLESMRAQAYTSNHKRAGYTRGALIALNWDAALKAASRSETVKDVVRDLIVQAAPTDGVLTANAFFDAMAARGIDAQGDDQRHVLDGEAVIARPDALGPGWRLTTVTRPRWSTGYSVESVDGARRITGVVDGGPAWRAGLRNGMTFVTALNVARFSQVWRADEPVTVVVDDAGAQRRISYAPEGAPITVPVFVPAETP